MSSMISTLFGDTDPLIPMVNKSPALTTPVDWMETPESHVFIVELLGLNKEEVKVEMEEGRVLKISGERKIEEKENDKWHCVKRYRGSFCRRFRLPKNANVEEIKFPMQQTPSEKKNPNNNNTHPNPALTAATTAPRRRDKPSDNSDTSNNTPCKPLGTRTNDNSKGKLSRSSKCESPAPANSSLLLCCLCSQSRSSRFPLPQENNASSI